MWLLIVVLTWIVEWLVLVYPRRDKRTDIFYRLGWGGRRILAVTIKFTWSPLRLCSIIMTPLPPLPLSLRSIFYKPPFEDLSPLHSPENHVVPLAKKLLGTSPRPLPGPPSPPPSGNRYWVIPKSNKNAKVMKQSMIWIQERVNGLDLWTEKRWNLNAVVDKQFWKWKHVLSDSLIERCQRKIAERGSRMEKFF